MFRTLLRLVVVIVVVAAIAAFFVGYRFGDRDRGIDGDPVVGTSGPDLDPDIDVPDPAIDVDRARATGARVGESIAVGASRAERAAADGALTAKIKSKMALDDAVEAINIDVDTDGSVVTLRGSVGSADERQRAVRLARETDGVTSVVDQLTIR
jgi:hypothetical protein